jgi:hypothetical protein
LGGLYRVEESWREPGRSGFLVCWCRLVRLGEGGTPVPLDPEKLPQGAPPRAETTVQRLVRNTANDFDAAASLLDPDVAWQGCAMKWVCQGREELLETFRMGLEQRREIDALEFTRRGDRVVLGARGPSITEVGASRLRARSLTSSRCATGKLPESDRAVAAAGVDEDVGWSRLRAGR